MTGDEAATNRFSEKEKPLVAASFFLELTTVEVQRSGCALLSDDTHLRNNSLKGFYPCSGEGTVKLADCELNGVFFNHKNNHQGW